MPVKADAEKGDLLAAFCSGLGESSNPYDYIAAHELEYRELVCYGEYMLRYCLN